MEQVRIFVDCHAYSPIKLVKEHKHIPIGKEVKFSLSTGNLSVYLVNLMESLKN